MREPGGGQDIGNLSGNSGIGVGLIGVIEDGLIGGLPPEERRIIGALAMTQGDKEKAVALGKQFNWLNDSGEPKKNRERLEFEDKLSNLGLKAPW